MINGFGQCKWTDGRHYTGQWVDDKMQGEGEYQFTDGQSYKGQFLDDECHGFGVWKWGNGKTYEGNWEVGKRHGKGILREPGSSAGIEVEYNHGVRVGGSSTRNTLKSVLDEEPPKI
jgi:hypothetical protein